jgi:hypothetical protein
LAAAADDSDAAAGSKLRRQRSTGKILIEA